MNKIYICDNDFDGDPLTESMSKLSMVVVNTKSKAHDDLEIIDLTLDSDSTDSADDYQSFNSGRLSKEIIDSIRSEYYTKSTLFEDFVQIYLDNIPITRLLLKTLEKSNSWLNDEMINAFFKLLGAAYPKSIFLNSFFFTNLERGLNVSSWLRKAIVKKYLFEYDHVIFPINHGNTHWSLGVIYIGKMEIIQYDSLGSSVQKLKKVYSQLLPILIKEAEQYLSNIDQIKSPILRTIEDLKFCIKAGDSPLQIDGNSCGVHTCLTAHRIAKGEALDFSSDQVCEYRKKMARNLALKI